MDLNKYQIKFELIRLQKLKCELVEEEIKVKVQEAVQQIYSKKQEILEEELEQLLLVLAQEIKFSLL